MSVYILNPYCFFFSFALCFLCFVFIIFTFLCVLVIYCYVKNYFKTQQIKTIHTFLSRTFCGSEILEWLSQVLCFRMFIGQVGLGSILNQRLSLPEDLLSSSAIYLLSGFSSSWALGSFCFLPHGPCHRAVHSFI